MFTPWNCVALIPLGPLRDPQLWGKQQDKECARLPRKAHAGRDFEINKEKEQIMKNNANPFKKIAIVIVSVFLGNKGTFYNPPVKLEVVIFKIDIISAT
jgi:hypothetical protein